MLRIIFCADAGFHARGTGDDFGANLRDDGDIGDFSQRRTLVAGNCGRVSAARAGIGHGGDYIGRAAGSGETDHDILAGGTAAGDVALAEFLGVFVDLDGGGQGLGAAGHDVLHLSGSRGIGGGTLGGIESSNAAARAGTDVDETATVAEAARHVIDYLCDFRKGLLDGSGDLGSLRD